MNITFLIGNGFYLNVGLATTYSDFLEKHAKPSDADRDLLKYFKQKILANAKRWFNAALAGNQSCGYCIMRRRLYIIQPLP